MLTPTLFGPSFHLYRMSLIVYPTEKIERPPAVGIRTFAEALKRISQLRGGLHLPRTPMSNLTCPLSLSLSPRCLFLSLSQFPFLSFFLSFSLSICSSRFMLFYCCFCPLLYICVGDALATQGLSRLLANCIEGRVWGE